MIVLAKRFLKDGPFALKVLSLLTAAGLAAAVAASQGASPVEAIATGLGVLGVSGHAAR
jgi:predicted nicotinamide N-methyase